MCVHQPLNTNGNPMPQTQINSIRCRIFKNNKLGRWGVGDEVLVARQHQYKALPFSSRAFSPSSWTKSQRVLSDRHIFGCDINTANWILPENNTLHCVKHFRVPNYSPQFIGWRFLFWNIHFSLYKQVGWLPLGSNQNRSRDFAKSC